MNLPGRQFASIARLTALEAMRQPICLLLMLTCLLLIGALPFLITHTLGGATQIVRDSALAVHLVFGLLLGSYVACSTLVREIRRGTASTVLSKPIGRGMFMFSKFCGSVLFMLLFSVAAVAATLLSTRVAMGMDAYYGFDFRAGGTLLCAPPLACAYGAWANYRRQRPFHSVALAGTVLLLVAAVLYCASVDGLGARVSFGAGLPLDVLPAAILVSMATLVLTAIAVSLAARLDVVPTLSICSVLLMLGLISDYALGQSALAGHAWARLLYALLPNWQHFWVVDALHDGGRIAGDYVARVGLYALCYSAGCLFLGAFFFRRMELK
jgi:ABC-type transport system involved in multi-copper enzyme maturation permease subunit